jgi:acetoin utilization deacetylase AcuC-like enzyme
MKEQPTMERREFIAAIAAGITGASCGVQPLLARGLSIAGNKGTGYAYSSRFPGYYQNSAEVPQRVEWINKRIVDSGLDKETLPVTPIENPLDWISKVHNEQHIQSIQSLSVYAGASERIGDIAELAVAYVLGAVQGVCEGKFDNAFCNIRPPGHHVQNGGYPTGYCVYANVVIAAKFARERFGIKRVLVIDWDYHHGNGTEFFLQDDPDALFFDTCGGSFYTPSDRIHGLMSCGANNDDFVNVWNEKLIPAAREFKPQLVLICCGFDSKRNDTHGCFDLTAQGFSRLTRLAMDIAQESAEGRVVSILEGGYADRDTQTTFSGLACCAESHVRTLVSREVQPEAEYYATSARSRPRITHYGEPSIRNGILHFNGMKPVDIEIMNAAGKKLPAISRGRYSNGMLNLRELCRGTGCWILRVVDAAGNVSILRHGI